MGMCMGRTGIIIETLGWGWSSMVAMTFGYADSYEALGHQVSHV